MASERRIRHFEPVRTLRTQSYIWDVMCVCVCATRAYTVYKYGCVRCVRTPREMAGHRAPSALFGTPGLFEHPTALLQFRSRRRAA
jgi:hypothetical protein